MQIIGLKGDGDKDGVTVPRRSASHAERRTNLLITKSCCFSRDFFMKKIVFVRTRDFAGNLMSGRVNTAFVL